MTSMNSRLRICSLAILLAFASGPFAAHASDVIFLKDAEAKKNRAGRRASVGASAGNSCALRPADFSRADFVITAYSAVNDGETDCRTLFCRAIDARPQSGDGNLSNIGLAPIWWAALARCGELLHPRGPLAGLRRFTQRKRQILFRVAVADVADHRADEQ